MSLLKTNAIQTTSGQPILNSTGSIIQVVYGNMGSSTATISSQEIASIPGCSVSITPTRSSSKILLLATVVSSNRYVVTYGFTRNGTAIGGSGGGIINKNSANSIVTEYWSGGSTDQTYVTSVNYQYLDSPGITSSFTYAPAACSSWDGTIYPLAINDRTTGDMRSLTSITAIEVLA
jgi:hypothetical protein